MMCLYAVHPNHLSPIFTLDAETGILRVDGRGPHLDANGTTGSLNVHKYSLHM